MDKKVAFNNNKWTANPIGGVLTLSVQWQSENSRTQKDIHLRENYVVFPGTGRLVNYCSILWIDY